MLNEIIKKLLAIQALFRISSSPISVDGKTPGRPKHKFTLPAFDGKDKTFINPQNEQEFHLRAARLMAAYQSHLREGKARRLRRTRANLARSL